MNEPVTAMLRSIYKRIWLVPVLVLIAIGAGVATYFAWYHFSVQRFKIKYGEFESDVRRIERNARVGYHFRDDPEDTSPFGVFRFTYRQYDKWNDGEVIEGIRKRYPPNISKTDFYVWMRDPYGQEKIDSYLEHHKGDEK